MKNKNTVNNINEYDTRLIVWALSRQGYSILATKISYECFQLNIREARAYTIYLSGCTNFPESETVDSWYAKEYKS